MKTEIEGIRRRAGFAKRGFGVPFGFVKFEMLIRHLREDVSR